MVIATTVRRRWAHFFANMRRRKAVLATLVVVALALAFGGGYVAGTKSHAVRLAAAGETEFRTRMEEFVKQSKKAVVLMQVGSEPDIYKRHVTKVTEAFVEIPKPPPDNSDLVAAYQHAARVLHNVKDLGSVLELRCS